MSGQHDSSHGAEGGGEPAAADPSMEDILASIRRILNEEEAPVESAEPAAAPVPVESERVEHEPPNPDVLELDHTMMLPDPEPAPPVPAPIVVPPPVIQPMAEALPPSPPPLPLPAAPLVAPAAAAAAALSVGALMRTLATERSTQVHRGGPTIEDLVREEIRPFLKEWLDEHLAPMVERLVRAEIERVVSRMT